MIQKEKERKGHHLQNKAKGTSENSEIISCQNNQNWFRQPLEKAILLNRYEGHTWSQLFLRCSFLDDYNFCSSSEDGFLCVWNLYQSHPIQKQKVSKYVLNDVAVFQSKSKCESINELKEEKGNGENGNSNGSLSLLGGNRKQGNKPIILVGCDENCVKIL